MTTEAPTYFNESAVKGVLTWPLVNEAVEQALKAVSAVDQPARSITKGDTGVLLTMPAFIGNYKLSNQPNSTPQRTLSCKVVTAFNGNTTLKPPIPSILANVLLFNADTGRLKCIMEGTQITAWRTAAASIVSTKYLYFQRLGKDTKSAVKLAIIGCGVQGRSHAFDMCSTFNVQEVQLWNRTVSKAETLALDLKNACSTSTEIFVASTAAQAVADADIICVGTYSAEALVTESMLPKKKIHINTVGAGQVHFGEIANDIYARGTVYVDSWANARTELKDLKANIAGEVGEIINGSANFSKTSDITIFQSMGMGSEDATVAQAVFNALA